MQRSIFFLLFIFMSVIAVGCEKENTNQTKGSTPPSENDTIEVDSDTNNVIADENTDTIRFLALGDSYTIGESVSQSERWPIQLSKRIQDSLGIMVPTRIIAQTGWTTDELQAGILSQSIQDTFDLVSLLIGVNNQYRGRPVETFIPEYIELIERAIRFAQGDTSKVFAVSIPNYGFTPFGEANQSEITQELEAYNSASDSICTVFNIPFVPITDISERGLEQPILVANDGLHPSGEQYRLWVRDRIYPKVKQLLETK